MKFYLTIGIITGVIAVAMSFTALVTLWSYYFDSATRNEKKSLIVVVNGIVFRGHVALVVAYLLLLVSLGLGWISILSFGVVLGYLSPDQHLWYLVLALESDRRYQESPLLLNR